jgi:predicted site-specific integrase-resolvase
MILVTYRNRPARLGALPPTVALSARGCRIVAGDHGQQHDPVRDLIEDPTSRCRRFYRHSHARTRAMRPVTATTQDIPEPQVV